MKIPKYLLLQRATVTPSLGHTAMGVKLGVAVTDVPCRIDRKRTRTKDKFGNDIVAEAQGIFLPGTDIENEYQVTCDGSTYMVIQAKLQRGRKDIHHIEVLLL